jgi:methyltransferase (TIGR00027 family)
LEGGKIFTDPLATRILGEATPSQDQVFPVERVLVRQFIAVRHRLGEDRLAEAVARGTRQVVILGAGLDSFAYRNPHASLGVHVWEVDFPATQTWKRERLAAAKIVAPTDSLSYVGIDFETQELLPQLVAAGLDIDAPTFFLWLGVVPYLTHAATTSTLAAIGKVPGGEVVFDYASPTRPDDGDLEVRARLAASVAAVGEPFGDLWEPAAIHAVLRSSNLTEIDDISRQEIRSRYLGQPPGPPGGGAHIIHARSLLPKS